MILIPELETVLILVPRTGSGSLRRAVTKTHPRAVQLYRHMEADGVPSGYDRWQRLGIVREPVDRLWSLYKFLRSFHAVHSDQGPEYREAQIRSVDRPFDEWLIRNETVFTSPYDTGCAGKFYPFYTVRHPLPENRKSQFVYLRPDLGTTVFQFTDLEAVASRLGVKLDLHNTTLAQDPPELSRAARDHLARCFEWDIGVTSSISSRRRRA